MKRLNSLNLIALCLTLSGVFLVGCGTPPTPPKTEVAFDVPEGFKTSSDGGQTIEAGWLKTFNDPQLDKIIAEVLEKNFDLQTALAQVDAAAAAAKQAGAALTPAVNFAAQAGN